MPKPPILCLILLLFVIGSQANAQSVEGKWYGIGRVQMEDESDNYMTEMILKQDGKQVKGSFNYYFKDSQKSNKIEGDFDKKTRILNLRGLPVIFYKNNDTSKSIETVMKGRFELRVSKTASILNGLLYGKPEYQYIVPEIKYRFLRSMAEPIDTAISEEEQDFWAMDEKFENKPINSPKIDSAALTKDRNKAKIDKDKFAQTKKDKDKIEQSKIEALKESAMAKAKVPKTDATKEAEVKSNNKVTTANNKNEYLISNTIPVTALAITSTTSNKNQIEQPLPIKDTIPIVETRQKSYIREIVLDNDQIRVEIFDNGTIDYDSVSLYLNGKEVMAKTMLNHRSIKVNLQMDPNKEFNELSMFAENLGMIPPNTAALILRDGQKEYQLLLQSDFSKSATLKLKVKKPSH